MKVERGTISIHFVQNALRCVQERRMDVDGFLQRAGIPPHHLHEPLARVSPDQFGALWLDISHRLDDEFFGLDSHPMRPGSYALMCHSALGSANLAHALKRILHFLGVVLDDLRGELVVQDGQAHIRVLARQSAKPMFAYATYLMMVFSLSCWLVGRRIPISSAAFASSAQALVEPGGINYAGEYRVLFCENLAFDQACTVLSFPASYLKLPVVQDSQTIKQFFGEMPAKLLVKYRNPKSWAAKVRRHLRNTPPADWPDADQICVSLNVSEATLRRRLKEEGHTYQTLKDDVRRDQAIAALQDGKRSLADVAADLGFAEPSAFYRAFKKWTGGRPSDYRSV
ncbi:MAG: AraC family transcriptional regulator [Burkholderiales bacterium]|nr:AraC family transcriptional regulator [Burkholderiales bacterium]